SFIKYDSNVMKNLISNITAGTLCHHIARYKNIHGTHPLTQLSLRLQVIL
ncbi:hypothetical protein ALC62_01586, partial [Cyphomyrmex costatus]